MTSMVTKSDDKGSKEQKDKDKEAGFFKKLIECTSFVIKYMTGISDKNFYTDLSLSENISPPFPFGNYDPGIWKKS